jgi:hypothetical protein
MVPTADESKAVEVFGIIGKTNVSEKAVEEAIEYINKASFMTDFNDEQKRNEKFLQRIIKQYSVLLSDIEEVKQYLNTHVNGHPYDWLTLGDVNKRIEEMARGKYDETGCHKALEKIDKMNSEDVRKYLRELIADHIDVGMAIISE